MNCVFFYIALILVIIVQLSDGGFIKQAVAGIIGRNTSSSYTQNYVGAKGDEWMQGGSHSEWVDAYARNRAQQFKNTNWQGDNQRYPPPDFSEPSRQKQSQHKGFGSGNSIDTEGYRSTGLNQGYKNTTAHIIDEDYLTSTKNETLQHQQRPTSQYGGGGTYQKKPSSSGPYKNTTAHIVDEDYLTSTKNETLQHQQRPTSQYGGGGTYNKKPYNQSSTLQGQNMQKPSYQEQRPNTQMSFSQHQRPNTQMPYLHHQQRSYAQMPSLHHQQRPNTQASYFQHQQRSTYGDGANFHKRDTFSQSWGFGGGSTYSSTNGQRNDRRHTNTPQGYKNTTAHIVDMDYLTSNAQEYSQHRRRPTSGYGGGGTYNKRDTSSQIVYRNPLTPNTEVTFQKQTPILEPHVNITSALLKGKRIISHIATEGFLTPNADVSNQNETNRDPTITTSITEDNSNKPEATKNSSPSEPISENATASQKHRDISNTQNVTETLRHEVQNGEAEKENVSNCIILQSNSITCVYSNVKEEKIENRKMRCNDIECKLEKNFDKSSLWTCMNIKCTVANVDFSQDLGEKPLIECKDERSIITVQDKPIKCGPDEKEHNGRCRKVFGA